jgi:hypothetical protein
MYDTFILPIDILAIADISDSDNFGSERNANDIFKYEELAIERDEYYTLMGLKQM